MDACYKVYQKLPNNMNALNLSFFYENSWLFRFQRWSTLVVASHVPHFLISILAQILTAIK